MKKSLTYEWIQITTKQGVTYQRRQRKKVDEGQYTSKEDFAEAKHEWENKPSLAGLKDALATSLKYNGNYYDSKGNPIYVPERYKPIAEAKHHSKNNDSSFTNFITKNDTDLEKQKKQRLIGLIKLKDKLYSQEYEKKKKAFETTQNNPAIIKRNISSFFSTIHTHRSSVNDMLYALKYARDRIDESIDPTITIKFNGKNQDKNLDETIARLEAAKASNTSKASQNTEIESIELKNLDEYNDDDFKHITYNMTPNDHADLVNRVNKHYEALKKLKD